MAGDNWIDASISGQLSSLRDAGEGQRVEFKVEYPQNGSEISKEIAAFASSNAGRIIIGVSDEGDLVGLPELSSAKGRDQLSRRIEGLCTNKVKPSITPTIKYAREGDHIVLIVDVPKGQQPVYYSDGKPYIRHHTTSRPAEPHEVTERIMEWAQRNGFILTQENSDNNSSYLSFFSNLHDNIVHLIIIAREFPYRNSDSWLDYFVMELASISDRISQMTTNEIAIELEFSDELALLNELLYRIENYEFYLGPESWREFEDIVSQIVEKAQRVLKDHVEIHIDPRPAEYLLNELRSNSRKLDYLVSRADQMANDGNIDTLKSEASRIGYDILATSYSPGFSNNDTFVSEIRDIGQSLHTIETKRMYLDGGKSIVELVSSIKESNENLSTLLLSQ